MANRVEIAFRSAIDRLIPSGSAVLAAVSGGGDSVALLHLLRRVSTRRSMRLTVAHLDHGLRRGSRADRRFVERLCRDLDLPCIADRREVPSLRRKDESPEEAARRVRREFLLETRKGSGSDLVATGHTLDDQAETVLMRLVRGAGPTALTGMAEDGPGPIVRPLLGVEREPLRTYLNRSGLAFRDDPSNRDLRFDRNRVRRLVLPLLAEALNPRAARHLVKASQRFREDALFLDAEAQTAFEALSNRDRRGRLVLDGKRLSELPPAIANRVARIALHRAGADARRIGSRHVDALIDLARAGGRSLNLASGITALRDRRRILLWSPEPGE